MDTIKLIEKREGQLADLRSRMDKDARLAYLDPFTLMRPDRPSEQVDGASNVTTNAPATFMRDVVYLMTTATWQTVVEGDLTGREQHKIEGYADALRYSMDERLNRKARRKLYFWLCSHICLRGWIGARLMWVQGKTGMVPDVEPVDMRWTAFEEGREGFNWVAPRTLLSGEQIKTIYDIEARDAVDIPCYDYWDEAKEEIWIDGKLAKTNKHQIGYPPFPILPSPEGFMLLDKEYMVHEGESILFLSRDMYPAWSQLLTVAQTKSLASILPNYQHEVEELSDKPEGYPAPMAEVRQVKKGERYDQFPTPDVPPSFNLARQDIFAAIQKGGAPDIDYSDTATGITEQTEMRNKLLAPRLDTVGAWYGLAVKMLFDQAIKGKINTSIGVPGSRQQLTPAALGDPDNYQITFKLMSRSKKQEIANLAQAGAARGIYSLETILTDIMQSDDPQGEMERIDAEKAESADPVLFYFRKAISLADQAEDLSEVEADQKKLESMRMTQLCTSLIRQRTQPQQPPQAEPGANAASLIPLLGQRGMQSGAMQ
jgi:hypothetical protein